MDVIGEGKRDNRKGRPLKKPPLPEQLIKQVMPDDFLKELITVKLADEAASVIVVGNIGWILREKVSDNLIDGIVSFLCQRMIDFRKRLFHFLAVISRDGELDGIVIQNVRLLYTFSISYTKMKIK